MKILLVSATKNEIAPLLIKFRKISEKQNISSYRFSKHTVDVLITGAGMTAAAFHLGKTLDKKYELAINAGIAGCFKKNIPLGAVVNVVSDRFADFGAEDGHLFRTATEIGLSKTISYQCSYFKIRGIRKVLDKFCSVNGITVNTVHGNLTSIKKAIRKFNPDIESMEGAAFFLACNNDKIPSIQIRSISNRVERRDKRNWKIDLAVSNLSAGLEKILSDLQ